MLHVNPQELTLTHTNAHQCHRSIVDVFLLAGPNFRIKSSDFDLFERSVVGGGETAPLEAIGAGPPSHFVRGNRFHEKIRDGEFSKNPADEKVEFGHGKRMLGSHR